MVTVIVLEPKSILSSICFFRNSGWIKLAISRDEVVVQWLAMDWDVLALSPAPSKLFSIEPTVVNFDQCQGSQKRNLSCLGTLKKQSAERKVAGSILEGAAISNRVKVEFSCAYSCLLQFYCESVICMEFSLQKSSLCANIKKKHCLR